MGGGQLFSEGAGGMTNSLMAGLTGRMQMERDEERYQQGIKRSDARFNRFYELERGRKRENPSFMDEMSGGTDPQEQATRDLQKNVMQHQNVSGQPEPPIIMTRKIAYHWCPVKG